MQSTPFDQKDFSLQMTKYFISELQRVFSSLVEENEGAEGLVFKHEKL